MRHSANLEEAPNAERKAMMALLARAPADRLQQLWDALGADVSVEALRGPETGLVTVRGRIGGGGAPFNIGETTVTRTTVRLAGGAVGHSYALGRDKAKSRLAATIDALWQQPEMRQAIAAQILAPLSASAAAADESRRAETAATRVDFFTMVRGED